MAGQEDARTGTYEASLRHEVREGKRKLSDLSPKPKRKASAYSKRYGAAFRKVAPRFKKKNGSWKTNGFKNAQKAAHKLAKKGSTKKGQVRKTARRAYER